MYCLAAVRILRMLPGLEEVDYRFPILVCAHESKGDLGWHNTPVAGTAVPVVICVTGTCFAVIPIEDHVHDGASTGQQHLSHRFHRFCIFIFIYLFSGVENTAESIQLLLVKRKRGLDTHLTKRKRT
ncbi:unnamed protein product [Pylaiella littoralis]